MLFSGGWLLLYLNKLPGKYDGSEILGQASIDFISGLSQLIDALVVFISFSLIALLATLALLLSAGALWRILKIIPLFLRKSEKISRTVNR